MVSVLQFHQISVAVFDFIWGLDQKLHKISPKTFELLKFWLITVGQAADNPVALEQTSCKVPCIMDIVELWLGDGIYVLSAFLGSSSPASLQGYTPYNHHLHHHHHHMLPAPIPAWEAKQQAVITQSAHSQLVSRPHLQTGKHLRNVGLKYCETPCWNSADAGVKLFHRVESDHPEPT